MASSTTLTLDLHACRVPNLGWLRRSLTHEPRDHLTLGVIERRLQAEAPGRYVVTRWVERPVGRTLPNHVVMLEFADPGEMISWHLTWL